jgi:hypothetical protein
MASMDYPASCSVRAGPMVNSRWAHVDFGSGELAIRYGDQVYALWFNQ